MASSDNLDSPTQRAADVRNSLERRLASVEEHSVAQLAACTELQLHAELVADLRRDIEILEEQLEELALVAEEQDTPTARTAVAQSAQALRARVQRLRSKTREAIVTSKRRLDASNARSLREALLDTRQTRPSTIAAPAPASSKDDELMNATANVTDGLRRTRQLLEQELERSSLSTQMLERSSQTLTLTSDQYTSFAGLLQASKNIINVMQKADALDRLLIIASLVFFGLVCVLIIKRRIIDRGVRAATVLTRIAGAPIVGSAAKSAMTAAGKTVQASASRASQAMQNASASASATASPSVSSAASSAVSVITASSASLAAVASSAALSTGKKGSAGRQGAGEETSSRQEADTVATETTQLQKGQTSYLEELLGRPAQEATTASPVAETLPGRVQGSASDLADALDDLNQSASAVVLEPSPAMSLAKEAAHRDGHLEGEL